MQSKAYSRRYGWLQSWFGLVSSSAQLSAQFSHRIRPEHTRLLYKNQRFSYKILATQKDIHFVLYPFLYVNQVSRKVHLDLQPKQYWISDNLYSKLVFSFLSLLLSAINLLLFLLSPYRLVVTHQHIQIQLRSSSSSIPFFGRNSS